MPLLWEAETYRLKQQAVDKEAQKGEACTASWFTDYYEKALPTRMMSGLKRRAAGFTTRWKAFTAASCPEPTAQQDSITIVHYYTGPSALLITLQRIPRGNYASPASHRGSKRSSQHASQA